MLVATRAEAEDLLAEKIREDTHAPTKREDRDLTLSAYAARWLKASTGHLVPVTHTELCPATQPAHPPPTRPSARARSPTKARQGTAHHPAYGKNAQGRPFSKNSLRIIKAVFSSLLGDAVEDEILLANPAMQLGRGKKKSLTQLTHNDILCRLRPMAWSQLERWTSR